MFLVIVGAILILAGLMVERKLKKRVLSGEYKEIPVTLTGYEEVIDKGKYGSRLANVPVYSYFVDGEEYTIQGKIGAKERFGIVYQDTKTEEIIEYPKEISTASLLFLDGTILLLIGIINVIVGFLRF